MDFMTMFRAIRQSDLDAFERNVAEHILWRTHCWQTGRKIAADCNMKPAKTAMVIKELKRKNWIEKVEHRGRSAWILTPQTGTNSVHVMDKSIDVFVHDMDTVSTTWTKNDDSVHVVDTQRNTYKRLNTNINTKESVASKLFHSLMHWTMEDAKRTDTLFKFLVAFHEATNIDYPDTKKPPIAYWFKPLQKMVSATDGSIPLFKKLLPGVIKTLDERGYTVVSPNSVVRAFLTAMAKHKRSGNPNDDDIPVADPITGRY